MVYSILSLIAAYFLGAIPSAYICGKKLAGVNIMEHGSGNVGATNTFRVLGWKIGSLVFLMDILKGFLAAWLGYAVGGVTLSVFCGLMAVIAHTFSIFLKLKGGKGVATGAGLLLFLAPKTFLIAVIIWVIVTFSTGYISAASIGAATATIIFTFIFYDNPFLLGVVTFTSLYIIWKHRPNIKRLLNGTENRVNWKEKFQSKKK